jgi:hypothetical protein
MNGIDADILIEYDDLRDDDTGNERCLQLIMAFPIEVRVLARVALVALRTRAPLAVALDAGADEVNYPHTKPDLWFVRALSCKENRPMIHVWSCCGEGLFAVPFARIFSLFPIHAVPADAAFDYCDQIVLSETAATASFAALSGVGEVSA